MSSLQKQLAVIAANSSKQLDLQAQRAAHGKSLLFDPKVAVSQNYATLYQICREGFDELCLLDSRFLSFANNLFSEQSREEERDQMTAVQNAELDAVLHSLLALLSPRLLLKPGQKAMEWLIRRFRVHEKNTGHVVLSFLPYHSTPLFLSLLAILPPRLPLVFKFLQPYISSMTNPPLHAICYSATNSPAFFSAFNQYILRMAREKNHSTIPLTFWSSIISQAVEGVLTASQSGIATIRKDRLEKALLQILPPLDDMLSIKAIPELEIAACMIITILAARAPLSEDVIDRLMEAVALTWTRTTVDARLISLAALAQHRKSKKLPRSISKRLLATEDLLKRLKVIASAYSIQSLVHGLIFRCIERLSKPGSQLDFDFIVHALKSKILNEKEITKVLQVLVSTVTAWQIHELPSDSDWDPRKSLASFFASIHETSLAPQLKSLADKGVDFTTLETVLQVNIVPEPVQVQAVASITAEPTRGPQQMPDMSILSTAEPPSSSFLAVSKSALFHKLAGIFSQSFRTEPFLESLLLHPILKRDRVADGDGTYISFLIRLSCSNYLAPVRSAALDRLADSISDHFLPADFDAHAITPYLLITLRDQSSHVRRAAGKCILEVSKTIKSNSKPWGNQALYASDATVLLLSKDDADLLVNSVLVPRIEECVMDNATVIQLLKTSLTGHGSSASKKNRSEQNLSKQTRSAISDFIAIHAVQTSLLSVRASLLQVLNELAKPASNARSNIILPAFKDWALMDLESVKDTCGDQGVSVMEINEKFVNSITSREPSSLHYLAELVFGLNGREDLIAPTHMRLIQLWSELDNASRTSLLTRVLDVSLRKGMIVVSSRTREQTKSLLRNLPLSPEDLIYLLDYLPKATNMPSGPAPKRRRTSRSETARFERAPQETIDALLRYTLVLEIVESSPAGHDSLLLRSLFNVLGELQGFGLQTDSGMVYLKSLAITSLLTIVDKLKNTKEIPEDRSIIRTDLVVETIRSTSDLQLQNACLLLISCLAVWLPEAVLHNVMPIFTLMGTTVLRQGDNYSAHVIDQTVSRVVPPLVASLKKRSREVVSGVVDLLVSFTVAFNHIPSHRRLNLFELVVEALGPEECLFAVVCMIVNRHPTDAGARHFVVELVNKFDAETDLKVLVSCVDLIADIFRPRRPMADIVLSMKDKNNSQDHEVAENLIQAVSSLLLDAGLQARIAESLHFERSSSASQQATFSKLMGTSIRLMQQLKETPCGQASKDMLSNVFRLLPTHDLVTCAQMLLDNSSDDVRDVVIETISDHVGTIKLSDKQAAPALLGFLSQLAIVLDQSNFVGQRKTAVECVQRIARRFGKQNSSKILPTVPIILGKNCLGSRDISLQVSSLHTLASIIRVMKEDILPSISNIMNKTIGLVNESRAKDDLSITLHDAGFSLINAVAESISFVFTGKLLDRALQLALASSNSIFDEPSAAREVFYQNFATVVEPVEAFSALERNFHWVVENQGFHAMLDYYKLAKTTILVHPKGLILKNTPMLFRLLRNAFDLRSKKLDDSDKVHVSLQEAEELELLIIDVALTMVMKINDATFRPFFIQLVDWASFRPKKAPESSIARAVALFNFLKALLYRLKGLMTSYMGYVLEFTSNLLQVSLGEDLVKRDLLIAVLGALTQSFECDDDEFWQAPSHFSAVAKHLLSLLDQPLGAIVPDNVIPAVTSFAAAASSADHYKAINADILKLFRSDSVHSRLAAVKCQRSLAERLGNDWLTHLPEMLPFMTELLEDEDERVERETRQWIKRVEEIAGENVDSMLQ